MSNETRNAEKGPFLINLFSQELEADLKGGRVYKRKIEPIKGAEQVREKISVPTILPDGTV